MHRAGVQKRARITSSAAGECSTSDSAAPALEKELERTLREFVRLRSVSSDPTLREDCFRSAKFLATLLESLGLLFRACLCDTSAPLGPLVAHSLPQRFTCRDTLPLQLLLCSYSVSGTAPGSLLVMGLAGVQVRR
jgi:hypothetical protein